MAFEVPALPYAYEALEPYIDAQTMHLHHDKHHQAYVDNFNAALEKAPELKSKGAEEILKNLNSVPEAVRTAVRNHGGGHVNHSMFWTIMGPQGGRSAHGRNRRRDQKNLRRLCGLPGEVQRCRRQAVRQRLGLAGQRFGRFAGHQHAQPGQPALAGPLSDHGKRCLGARVLPQIPEPESRISQSMVERSELERSQQTLRKSSQIT